MNDIVERLRGKPMVMTENGYGGYIVKQHNIYDYKSDYRPTYGWPEKRSVIVEPTMLNEAADEIERLREALHNILQKDYVVDCKDVARAALKEKL